MKIDNCRTQEFKGKIDYVVNVRNHTNILHTKGGKKINYNFDVRNNTKSITISGKKIDDCVAYYWIDDNGSIPVCYITAQDIELINDIPVEKKVRKIKPQKDIVYNFEIGDICHTGHYGSYPWRVISKTDKTITIEQIYCKFKPNDKYGSDSIKLSILGHIDFDYDNGYYFNSQVLLGFQGQQFDFTQKNIDNGDLKILNDYPGPISTFRLSKDGYYTRKDGYAKYSLYKGFSYSHNYND